MPRHSSMMMQTRVAMRRDRGLVTTLTMALVWGSRALAAFHCKPPLGRSMASYGGRVAPPDIRGYAARSSGGQGRRTGEFVLRDDRSSGDDASEAATDVRPEYNANGTHCELMEHNVSRLTVKVKGWHRTRVGANKGTEESEGLRHR